MKKSKDRDYGNNRELNFIYYFKPDIKIQQQCFCKRRLYCIAILLKKTLHIILKVSLRAATNQVLFHVQGICFENSTFKRLTSFLNLGHERVYG